MVLMTGSWITTVIIYLFVTPAIAQQIDQYWRDDWQCGPGYLAPNGQEAKCRANCCSKANWCGNSYAHCVSYMYRDYRCCVGEQCQYKTCEIPLIGMNASQSSDYVYPRPADEFESISDLTFISSESDPAIHSWPAEAARAIDGNDDGHWSSDTCSHTNADPGAWWMVDLTSSHCVGSVVIYNRQDCCRERLQSAVVRIGEDPNRNNPPCKVSVTNDLISTYQTGIPIACNLEGRYISISLSGSEFLTLCEVRAFMGVCKPEINLVGKTASQSSDWQDGTSGGPAVATRAIDGLTSGHLEDQTCAHTNADPGAWWMVDLDDSLCIGAVIVHITQRCCQERLGGAVFRLGDDSSRNNPSCELPIDYDGSVGHTIIEVTCNLKGRYLSITLPGTEYLTLCEVLAFPGDCRSEIPLSGLLANQSSTHVDQRVVHAPAERAVDGNVSSHSCSHTKHDLGAWWMIDLEITQCVGTVVIHNRQDCCQERLLGAVIRVGNDPNRHNPPCSSAITTIQIEANNIIEVDCNLPGRYVSITLPGTETLTLCEVIAYKGDCVQRDFCRANTTFDSKYGWLTWPQTQPGTTYFSDVTCANTTAKAGQPVAYRYCGLSTDFLNQYVGEWGSIEYLDCEYSIQPFPPEGQTNRSDCSKVFQQTTPQTPNKEETCSANVTQISGGPLTWPQTTAGEVAFSEEKCNSSTVKAGWPLAARYCKETSTGLITYAQWGSVKLLSCSEDEIDTATDQCETITTPSFGSRRLQNSDFVFLDSAISDGINHFSVGIQGGQDAYIILAPSRNPSNDNWLDTGLPKLVIGGWNNAFSGVICNSNQDSNADSRTRYSTPNIISSSEMRYFTISWTNNQLQLRMMGSSSPLFTHQLQCPVNVRYIGMCTGYSISMKWTTCVSGPKSDDDFCLAGETHSVDGPLNWMKTTAGESALSSEKCPENTPKAGWPVAVRYCKPSDQMVQWDEVKMLGCLEDVYVEYKAAGYCPLEWNPHGSHCYYVNTEAKVSFSEATSSCRRLGGNLTSIHSLEEQIYHSVLTSETGEPLWIGLHDVSNEGSFEWIDGTPLNFESWSSGQPDDWSHVGGEDCGHLLTNGQWNDRTCSSSLGFICKQPRAANDGFCPPDVTYSAIGIMTWQETPVGNTAFSDETCGVNTDNGGRSIGIRYCGRISEECTDDVTEPVFRECPVDWVGFDQYCYYLNDRAMGFIQAETACQQSGGNITSIHNAGEQAFIQELTKDVPQGVYIGLHDKINERNFVWVDDTPLDYQNWHSGEPNNGGRSGEDCAMIYGTSNPNRNGWWNDLSCTSRKQFVCKKKGLCTSKLGMENGRIKYGQLTSSSSWDSNHGPSRARLNQPRDGALRGAWSSAPYALNRDQWIQVDFLELTTVTAVIIQGRADVDQWVRNYKVEYTPDGSLWRYATEENGQVRIFDGNTDMHTPVVSQFPQTIQVMAIRIRPTEWHNYISMRFELVGCEDRKDTCTASSTFGWSVVNRRFKDGNDWTFVVPGKEIPCDGVITHWHYWGKVSRPFRAIVWKKVEGHQTTFDIVGINNIPSSTRANQIVDYAVPVNERFQVHRGDILGFAFQESLIAYESSPSRATDATLVRWYKNNSPDRLKSGTRATFTGSGNRAYSLSATVDYSEQAMGNECFTGRGEWGSEEIVPCNNIIQEYLPVMCRDPLGMEDETIKNDQITASSYYDHNHDPSQARLNYLSQGQQAGSWSARFNDLDQWIQVNLLHRQTVSGVVLQGRDTRNPCGGNCIQYVTKFKVQYGQDGFKWNYVKDTNNDEEVFDGNTDTSTPVTRYFHTPIAARFLRIKPLEWNQHISLRFELLGCQDCPLGWDVNGDHCYYVNTDLATFSDAQTNCERMDSNLTSIHSADEQMYHAMSVEAAGEYLWIGLHDRKNERRFIWIDGSRTNDYEPQWAPYQPDNVGEAGGDCVHLSIGGLWNDLPCTNRAGYICKKAKERRDGMCPAMVTSLDTKTLQHLTWENVLAGEIGFSDEVCPDDSHNVGSPLATRFCRPTSEWGNVQLLNCYDDIDTTTMTPVIGQPVGCQHYQTPNDEFDVNNPNVYDHHYYWPQIPSDVTYFTFKVRASNDVRISLSSEYRDVQNMYKIVLGGWTNTKSYIRPCKDCSGRIPLSPAVSTPAILSSDEYRDFYVSFDNGNIRVGREGEDPSVTYQSEVIYDIKYVGIGTGRGSTGDWRFCGFASAIADCPIGWELNGEYCYFVVMDPVTFSQAENDCENMGSAKLTSINNEQEQVYHTSLAARAGMNLWLGLHDRSNENNFVWVDESPYGAFDNWAPNQPDNHGFLVGEDCVHMQSGDNAGLWNDLPCSSNAGYICKQPKTPTCINEQTSSDYGMLNWPKTDVGDATFSDEVCPDNTKHSGSPIAFRRCIQDDFASSTITQGTWLPVKILGCDTVNSTNQQLTDSDVEAVSRKLSHFTQTMGTANAKDVHAVAWMVQNIASAESQSVEVLESMTQAVNTLVKAADPSLRTKYETDLSTSTSDIVRALEKQVDQTMQQQEQIQIMESSLMVVGGKVSSAETSAVQFASYETGLEDDKVTFTGASLTNKINDNYLQDDQLATAASIQIPLGALPVDTGTNVNVSFIAYGDDFLFRSRRLESQMLIVDGPIVATTIVASNLTDPVIVRIKGRTGQNNVQSNDVLPNDKSATESIRQCVFWDFQLENGVGDWSKQGCKFVEIIEEVTTCHCTHLSTFAVIRYASDSNVSAKLKTGALVVMSTGTKLAVAVTLIAIALTQFVFIGFKKIRESKTYHTICNFCGAFFALYIVFAAGIDATDSPTGCVLVSLLLHYFTLVSLLWLAVDIRFTYNDIKAHAAAVSSHVQPRSLIKAYVVAWGIPVFAVAITMGISFDDYKNSKYCAFAVGPALLYGAVIPLTVFILHNVVTFVCAICALRNRRPDEATDTSDNPKVRCSSQRLWATLVVSIVFTISLCLTYVFLANPLHATTRVLFGVSVVSLGFVTLGMYCFYLQVVRDVILPKVCFGRYPEIPAHSFGNPGYTSEEGNDHGLCETIEIDDVTTEK